MHMRIGSRTVQKQVTCTLSEMGQGPCLGIAPGKRDICKRIFQNLENPESEESCKAVAVTARSSADADKPSDAFRGQ